MDHGFAALNISAVIQYHAMCAALFMVFGTPGCLVRSPTGSNIINMLGSMAFGVSAMYAVVLPKTGDLLDVTAVNAWTLAGAICFLIGAYLLLPELKRNLRLVVSAIPND
jgi:hypothetical protein